MRLLPVFVLGLAAIACQKGPTSTHTDPTQPTNGAIAFPVESLAVPYCPECEMSFHKFPIRDTLHYDGKIYGFCSKECKEAFQKGSSS
ncbi:MAG: hypothetical protein N3A68_02915 [Bacteroidia bacterium]|nr:hypothetical protein [Bacteroidia bacterium]